MVNRAPSTGAFGAEDGIRTRDLVLGKDALYQLSHFREALIRIIRRRQAHVRPRARRFAADAGAALGSIAWMVVTAFTSAELT